MTRVAYVGNFEPEFSTENDVRAAFAAINVECIPLQENRTHPDRLLDIALQSDLLLWTGTWDDAQPLDTSLTTFKLLAQKGIPTACYHLDTFWLTARGGRQWWLHPMFHTSRVFTADGDHDETWARFGVNHTWLRPAVRHTACHAGRPREEYVCDVAFVGSNGVGYHEDVWPYRLELVTELRLMCERNGWSFRNPGGSEPKIDRGEAMNDFYASAGVTVGDSLCVKHEAARYWSDRAYEAPGRHGALIMPRIFELAADLPLPTYAWGDWDDLETKIAVSLKGTYDDYYAGAALIVAQEHTYVNRVQTLLEEML